MKFLTHRLAVTYLNSIGIKSSTKAFGYFAEIAVECDGDVRKVKPISKHYERIAKNHGTTLLSVQRSMHYACSLLGLTPVVVAYETVRKSSNAPIKNAAESMDRALNEFMKNPSQENVLRIQLARESLDGVLQEGLV